MKYKTLLFISLLIIACQKKNNDTFRLSGTASVFNDTLLVCSTLKDSVIIENIKNKNIIFSKKINDTEAIRPQPILDKNNRLYSVFSENKLSCIDIKTNTAKWTYTTEQKINAIKCVNDTLIVIGIRDFGLTALNSQTGKPVYHLEESHSSVCNSSFIIEFTFDKEKLYVSDFQCNTLSAYKLNNGKKIWSYKSDLEGLSKLLVYNNFIFSGITGNPMKNEGKILLLDKKTGTVLAEENQTFDLIANTIVYNNNILYYTYDGVLKEFDLEAQKSKTFYKFNKENKPCDSQFHLIGNDLYFEDCQFNIVRFNLKKKTLKKIEQKKKGLNAVYLYNNEVKFVY
ncbi:PQQ-binding-like beta-propeller repeat protein [Flavobacterium artemisiae]|uniref:PQQ-binding-like beta-propeller repeat protein n=1 Tax=Flavobacterium artemisiae TaxID=2126556 RepID=A0ABW4H9J8_9FLAO